MKSHVKAMLLPLLVCCAGMLLLPYLALLPKKPATEYRPPETQPPREYEGEGFLVLDLATGQVSEMSDYQYVVGSVLSEMPASYGEEALKAQAVASHTYAMLMRQNARKGEAQPVNGADFSVDSSACSGYMDPADAEKYLGRDWEGYVTKVERVVQQVIGEALYYNGELISACYHAISPGRTEDSGNVFSVSVPYLAPVDSSWDKEAEGYETRVVLEPYTMDSMLKLTDQSYNSTGDPATWLGKAKKSQSGTVLEQEICGKSWKGTEIREALCLRSAAFDMEYRETEGFVINVYGYGHAVGMSQVGAGHLAEQGKSYREILSHYYPGSQLLSITSEA